MCSHACYNDEPNARYASVYQAMESRYNPERLPSFFVGDLNTSPDSEASRAYRRYWNDACLTVERSSRTGLLNTYNDYDCPLGISRIDYLYYRGGGIDVVSYNCDGSLYGGRYASGHGCRKDLGRSRFSRLRYFRKIIFVVRKINHIFVM